MENNLKIIEASINELTDICSIESALDTRILSDATIKKELCDKNHLYFIGYKEKTPVAYIGTTLYIDHIDLDSIATIHSQRRNGFASLLLQKLFNKAKEMNINKIFLEVNENNSTAIEFYKKHGFNYISTRRNYYKNNENALIYCYTF